MPGEFYQGRKSLVRQAVDRGAAARWRLLEDEIARLSGEGSSAVLSRLTTDEERDLGLENEPPVARELGMEFVSSPVPDRRIPPSEREFAHAIEWRGPLRPSRA